MLDSVPTGSPERDLWQEVLHRAIDDALRGPPNITNVTTRQHICREARAYLTTCSSDLSIVCSNAGLDMQAVIEAMKMQIAKAPAPEVLIRAPKMNRLSAMKGRYKHSPIQKTFVHLSNSAKSYKLPKTDG